MDNNLIKTLNPSQQEAVLMTDGPLAIIAGAGSGKTRTITHKVAYLIQDQKVDPGRILAVTFSNKAAQEMKNRILQLVGNIAENAQISTYHSLCARILRHDIQHLGFSNNFNIIDNIDQKLILKPAYQKFGLSPKILSYKNAISYISTQKFNQTPLDALKKDAEAEYDQKLVDLYAFYLEETKKTNSLDFDDLIIYTAKLFAYYPNVVQKWVAKFDYVLADEFQDTSNMQYGIIKALAKHRNITVVGDPDQTIYLWRGADDKLFTKFKKDFPDGRSILLTENYRSTPEILKAANQLISFNKTRVKKALFTSKEQGPEVEYYHGFSEDAEARWIVQQINLLRKNKIQLRNIAILFRANYLSRALEKALIKENIDYVLFGGVRFYQRMEIKDAIAFLKIINNGDEVSMQRVINTPSRKIGRSSLEKLLAFKTKVNKPLFSAMVNHFTDLPLSKTSLAGLADFINLINKYRSALKTYNIATVLEKFLIEINYYSLIPKEETSRVESLKELVFSIKEWEKVNPKKTLNDFLTEISLFVDKDARERWNDYVSLMTVHTAKGAEYDNVFIFSLSEEVFPSRRAFAERGQIALEEERRLAYVAVTRAKHRLFITSSKGLNLEYTMQKKPSRFLKEMGVDYRKFTTEFIAPKDITKNYEHKSFIEGDKVVHEKFGMGIILNISGKIAKIAFGPPYGIKSMMKNHKSLRKMV